METALVSPTPLIARSSRSLVWTGRVLTGLIVASLLLDGIAKLIPLAPVIEGTRQLGYPVEVIRPLGALLLTAYLGGATATHVRVEAAFWFPVVMGMVLWAGLCLRNPRVRALVLAPPAA